MIVINHRDSLAINGNIFFTKEEEEEEEEAKLHSTKCKGQRAFYINLPSQANDLHFWVHLLGNSFMLLPSLSI
jgi:hypothetical protein